MSPPTKRHGADGKVGGHAGRFRGNFDRRGSSRWDVASFRGNSRRRVRGYGDRSCRRDRRRRGLPAPRVTDSVRHGAKACADHRLEPAARLEAGVACAAAEVSARRARAQSTRSGPRRWRNQRYLHRPHLRDQLGHRAERLVRGPAAPAEDAAHRRLVLGRPRQRRDPRGRGRPASRVTTASRADPCSRSRTRRRSARRPPRGRRVARAQP